MLFGCIHVPDFPVQAALRGEPNPGPVALLDGPESLLKIVACNDLACDAGIDIGMTKLEAEVCPGVTLKKRVIEDEESAQAALLECGYSFSPRVESTCPGTIIVDLTGSDRLLGDGQAIGPLLLRRSEECDLKANVGIAANPDTALCAARGLRGITIIAPGEEAARLAHLPVRVLEPTPETLDILDAWGIRDFQSLAVLPPIPLTQRLGQYGLHLQRLAKGGVERELVPAETATLFHEDIELEEAVELLEPLSFILNRLLEQLTSCLKTRSLATDHVQVDLFLEVHPDRELSATSLPDPLAAPHQRALKLPVPTQDAKVLLKLLQLDLAAHPPQAPVKKIRIEVRPVRIRSTQTGLFQPLAPEAQKLEITLARLRAVAGETDTEGRGRVGFPVIVDSHRPDSFEVLPIAATPPRASISASTKPALAEDRVEQRAWRGPLTPDRDDQREFVASSPLALRWFRPAVAANVELSNSRPVAVQFRRKKARVVHATGPWRTSGTWWDANESWNRDEWDVHLSVDGASGLYRIFRDHRTGQWFVEGMYD